MTDPESTLLPEQIAQEMSDDETFQELQSRAEANPGIAALLKQAPNSAEHSILVALRFAEL